MTIIDFLEDNWGLIVLLAGFTIILATDIYLERRMVRRIFITSILLMIYSVSCYVETYFGNLSYYTFARSVLTAMNYSLVTFILVNAIMLLFPEQKSWVYIPALVNALLCFVSIPTGIVFSITQDNHFVRGPIGYLVYIVNAGYLVYLSISLFRKRKNQKEDYFLLSFILITAGICLIAPLFLSSSATNWFYLTIAIDVLMYYVFLLQQYTKRDPLTHLLNRQSYYADSENLKSYITAVITMDMNGLKDINDKEGHVAGDIALKSLADCFWKAAQNKQRIYRIGGDEYVILCFSYKEDEVKSLVERIRTEVDATPYTCSVGYAMKTGDNSVEATYNLADKMLYEEKEEYYIKSGKDRRCTSEQ